MALKKPKKTKIPKMKVDVTKRSKALTELERRLKKRRDKAKKG